MPGYIVFFDRTGLAELGGGGAVEVVAVYPDAGAVGGFAALGLGSGLCAQGVVEVEVSCHASVGATVRKWNDKSCIRNVRTELQRQALTILCLLPILHSEQGIDSGGYNLRRVRRSLIRKRALGLLPSWRSS